MFLKQILAEKLQEARDELAEARRAELAAESRVYKALEQVLELQNKLEAEYATESV